MKLAHIAPTSLLGTEPFKDLDFHLCLASQALKDEEYAKYFRNAKGYVILDVPTREEKDRDKPYSLSKLYKAIEIIQPSEVTLPDLWGGTAQQSIDIAYEAAINLTEMNPPRTTRGPLGLLAVPRGVSWEEYRYCAMEMAKIPGVTTLGIVDGTYEKFLTSREKIALDFSRWCGHINLHLLGVQKDLSDISNPQIRHHVRSADTAKLVRFGLEAKRPMYGNVPEYTGRGDKFFERTVSEVQLSYIARNIKYWNNLVAQ